MNVRDQYFVNSPTAQTGSAILGKIHRLKQFKLRPIKSMMTRCHLNAFPENLACVVFRPNYSGADKTLLVPNTNCLRYSSSL